MKHLLTTAIAALVAGTTAASAGNIVVPVVTPDPLPPAPVAYDWTGFYAGLHYGSGTLDDSIDTPNGQWMGGQVGYLFDFGSVIAGGELSYSQVPDDFWASDHSVARLKGRVGYDAGMFQPYVLAGVSQWMYPGATYGTANGYLYGLGGEIAVTDNIRVGLEYIVDGNNSLTWSGGTGPYDFETQEITLRVSMSF